MTALNQSLGFTGRTGGGAVDAPKELLPCSTPPAGVPALDVAPVVAGVRGVEGDAGEQMMFGGM